VGRKLLGTQLRELREAKGRTIAQVVSQIRSEKFAAINGEQIERLESGFGRFSSAEKYAAVFGKYVIVTGFYPKRKLTAAEMAFRTGLDPHTVAAAIRKLHSPANEADIAIETLEALLGAWPGDTASLSLSDYR
jgi:hypothetical protein